MDLDTTRSRRSFLAASAGLALGACAATKAAATPEAKPEAEPGISPTEDLMREHGVLSRALLVYDEACARLAVGKAIPAQELEATAALIQRFIEGYHEPLEEQELFPRFERAGVEVELVATLRRQHQAGRGLTASIRRLATASGADDRAELARSMRRFVRMYRPHEAREDTVLFPAFRALVPAAEYEDLGEIFEEKEHALFGDDGFEKNVAEVARIERAFGIHDLAAFTPA